GGARDPAGARATHVRPADRRAPRRHERRGGTQDPGRSRAAEPVRRGDDARRGQARGGAGRMSAWSERAQAYRESPGHREGADLDLVVEWCEPAEGVKALDVATGGGHVARRLREAGCQVVTLDPSPGMQADVLAPAEHIPFDDGAFD